MIADFAIHHKGGGKSSPFQAFLDSYLGDTICSKQLYKEALNHAFDELKQWEINEIVNQCEYCQY